MQEDNQTQQERHPQPRGRRPIRLRKMRQTAMWLSHDQVDYLRKRAARLRSAGDSKATLSAYVRALIDSDMTTHELAESMVDDNET